MPRPYPTEFRERALELLRSGRTVVETAELLGIDRVHDQRDRVRERADPESRPRPRALPDRAGSAQVRLPRRHGTRPDGEGQSPLDPTMEASPQRIRHPIRRPTQRRTSLTTQPSYTVRLTDPWTAKELRQAQVPEAGKAAPRSRRRATAKRGTEASEQHTEQ